MRKLLLSASAALLLSLPAVGQTFGTAGTGTYDITGVELDKTVVITTPTEVRAKLRDLLSDPDLKGLPLSDVRLEGRAKLEPDPQQRGSIARLNWSAVSLADGSKRVGLSQGMSSDLLTASPQLAEGQEMGARGDEDALKEAIIKLLGDPKDKDEKAEEDTEEEAETQEAEEKSAEGGSSGTPQASGMTPQNNVGSYNPADIPEEEAPSGSISLKTTACEDDIDENAGVVYFMSATTVTGPDGETTGGECQRSGFPVDIKYNYQACEDNVDLTKRSVTVRRKKYYINQQGENTDIGGCVDSPEEVHDIKAEANFCPGIPVFNGDDSVYQIETELVYYDRNSNRQLVDGCAFHEGDKEWKMTETANGCGYFHQFDLDNPTDGISYQQTRWVYNDANGLQDVTGCANSEDTALEFVHNIDTAVCEPFVDKGKNIYDKRYQIRIDTPTGADYISDCRLVGDTKAIEETFAGCETQHYDDFITDQSFLFSKWIIKSTGEVVSDCEKSLHTVNHQKEPEGWENNDETRTATQKTAVYITLPSPVGKTLIDGPKVRDDSVKLTYSYQSTKDLETGETEYEGCNLYATTAETEVYTRPDTTMFYRQIGDGEPVFKGSDCETVVTWNDANNSYYNGVSVSNHGRTGPNGQSGPYRYTYSCYKRTATTATAEVIRNGDGAVIQTMGPNTGYAYNSTSTQEYISERYDSAMWTPVCQSHWNGSWINPIPGSTKRSYEINWGWN